MNRYVLPIAILILSLTAGTVLYRSISSTRERRFVEASFFNPYFNAVSNGRYADAWLFHTPAWRSRHSLADFTEHYRKVTSSRGTILGHEVVGTGSTGSGLTVQYQIKFRTNAAAVTYGLVPQPEAGRWGIDRAVVTASQPDESW